MHIHPCSADHDYLSFLVCFIKDIYSIGLDLISDTGNEMCVWKHQDLEIFGSKLKKNESNFQPLEVVGHGSERQLQEAEKSDN